MLKLNRFKKVTYLQILFKFADSPQNYLITDKIDCIYIVLVFADIRTLNFQIFENDNKFNTN